MINGAILSPPGDATLLHQTNKFPTQSTARNPYPAWLSGHWLKTKHRRGHESAANAVSTLVEILLRSCRLTNPPLHNQDGKRERTHPMADSTRRPMLRHLKFTGLVVACLMAGWGFYRMSGDGLNAFFFTFGIMGIVLSAMRQPAAPSSEKNGQPDRDLSK